MISYLPGAVIEIKSHVNSTAGGILRVSLCSRSDSFRSEEEDCRYDMPLVELNSNSRDILLNPSKEVTKSFLLPEEFVCTHCVLQWRFTEGDYHTCLRCLSPPPLPLIPTHCIFWDDLKTKWAPVKNATVSALKSDLTAMHYRVSDKQLCDIYTFYFCFIEKPR